MKNVLIILALSFVSFSLSAQSITKKKLFKKKAKKEQIVEKSEMEGPDLYKVGHHLRNAGWSFLGAVIAIPYTVAINFSDTEDENGQIIPRTSLEELAGTGSILTSAALLFNVGAQTIKAGWELKKFKK